MEEFISEFLIFRKKGDQFLFRVIENPTNEWKDIKIHELTVNNQQVSIACITKDEDMIFGGEGRSIYATTRIWLQDWQEITEVDAFKKCLDCEERDCDKDCSIISTIRNYHN